MIRDLLCTHLRHRSVLPVRAVAHFDAKYTLHELQNSRAAFVLASPTQLSLRWRTTHALQLAARFTEAHAAWRGWLHCTGESHSSTFC